MKRLALASTVLLATVSWLAIGKDTPSKTVEIKLNGHTFTLPVGFEIELIAGPPLVNRPITADFDEQGRLYIADSSGSNERVTEQFKKKPHRIVRLEDTDGDGKFDKSTVFADKMMFPEGTMWYAGSLYVSAPPTIWKLTDRDGDGVAEERVEWFDGKTLTGCANDLHGPYLGPDGWIYWCKGAFAPQIYDRPGRTPMQTRAAHIFRARPDGTGVEAVMTGGMDNPVDVVFTPGGERIFTTTFLVFPGGGLRDGLIHNVYGGVYGKTWDVVYNHPWTGPTVMPVLSHLGPAAPCGLTRFEADAFGPGYKDNIFACLFNMRKITRHVLEPNGATFKSRDEDFLVSDHRDFHPTDVLEDADGSLIVVDTGGWYKLCCPTSQLYKPDVLGAVYRVRKKDVARPDDPRGLKLAWSDMSTKQLAALLDEPRPAVRKRAIQALGKRNGDVVPVLAEVIQNNPSVEARRNAVWAATRIDRPDARAAVQAAIADSDDTVRQAALNSMSVHRDRTALPLLLKMLKAGSPQNRRAAAEAIGRIGDKSAVRALLEALGEQSSPDRFLEHSLIFALIEIGDAGGTTAGLKSSNSNIRRAALIALDQMERGNLAAASVARELASADPAMKEAAAWIVGRHADWGNELVGFLRSQLTDPNLSAAERQELAGQLARQASSAKVQKLLAETSQTATKSGTALIALQAMTQSRLKNVPVSWIPGLTQALTDRDETIRRQAIAAARSLPISRSQAGKLGPALLDIARNRKMSVELRLQALTAVPGGLAEVTPEVFAFTRAHLDREQPVAIRSLAADVLARAHLSSAQLMDLAGSFKSIGPMEVNRLLDAFTQSTDEKVGKNLIAVLSAPSLRTTLRIDTLKPRLKKYGPTVQKEAVKLYALLEASFAEQRAKLDQMLAGLKDGDIRRGQAVFNSPKAACVSCHAIGYIGGKVGPDLTRIGQIRSERDLLESIVFPSASFVRGYEPVVVTTKDGKLFNGLVQKDSPDEIVLATGTDKQERILRDQIEDIQASQVSVMPAGLEQQLTVRDLADLVAFLKACR